MGKVERGAEIASFGKPRIGSQDSDSRRSSLACRSLASSILVAPQAKIMRLKSFNAKGTGYDSDILRFPQTAQIVRMISTEVVYVLSSRQDLCSLPRGRT